MYQRVAAGNRERVGPPPDRFSTCADMFEPGNAYQYRAVRSNHALDCLYRAGARDGPPKRKVPLKLSRRLCWKVGPESACPLSVCVCPVTKRQIVANLEVDVV